MRKTSALHSTLLVSLLATPGCASAQNKGVPATTESNVSALLEQLQPNMMVVDGDPIETTTLDELMREHHVPGVSIAVIRNGKIDWARGFGIADVESGRKVTTQTLFQAASISKPVAAAAALSMVQDGLLELDEDVNLKLKSWKLPTNEFTEKQPVTLRHLLSHSAGINVLGLPGYARIAKWPSTIDILEGRGNTDPVRVESLPGTNWRYSDGGYVIIGQLMEDVAGKPYPEILRERVFEPAGMTHSTYVQPLPLERENEAATAYARDGSAINGRYRNYPEIGAAGLWTTAEDLARFALAIQQSRAGKPDSLLSSRLVGEMLTPVMSRYGLGAWLSEDGERFGHGGTNRGFRIRGANRGFRTRLSASINDGWGIVVMTNGDGGSALCELLPLAAARAYGWSDELLLDAYGTYGSIQRKRVDIGEAALARLAGTYEILPKWSHAVSRVALFPNMGTVELKAMNGRLIADVPEGAGRVEFLPQSEIQVMQRRNGLLMDFTVEDGQVTGFTFREVEAKRVEAELADVDPYFVESSGISSNRGPQVITRNVLQDSKGGFWLATWHGVIRFDGTTFTNVTNKDGLRRYRAFSLMEDHQDNVWLGTTGAGLYRYDGKTYTNFTTKDGLVDDTVLSMMQDSDNNIWFGGMGLTKYDGTTFTSFNEEDGFTSSDVHSISQSSDGTMWFGTRGALFHYDGNTFVNFTEEHGVNIERNSYTPALIDRRGHVWFSGSNGIYHYDGEQVQHVFEPASFSLMEDSSGNIWFSGGSLKGEDPKPGTSVLNRFDPAAGLENILAAREQIAVKTGAIFGLSEDEDGNIWFGTGRGIGRIHEDSVQFYTRAKRESVAVDAQVLNGYVGRYQASTGDTVTIRTYEGLLVVEEQGQRMNLIAESAARFRVTDDESAITFFTAATGQKGLWARQRIWRKLPETATGVSGSEGPENRSALEARSARDFLIFRNAPSWGRPTDFENVLVELGCKSEQRKSSAMADLDLSHYGVIIIPGAQRSDYYNDYVSNVERFDDYVAKGGTLVFELNGAENSSIMLPRGVAMASHGAVENAILASDHPVFFPLSGERLIRANYASHGYLRDVPSDALILAVEANGKDTLADRPTFVEYPHGKGRVIAACQCFHDQDDSGRGPLMESVISYALAKSWAAED